MGFWTFGYSNLIRSATTLWQTQMTACLRKQCWKLDLRQSYLMLTTHWKHQTGNISFPSNLVAFPERTLTHNSRRRLHAKCDKTDMDATINDITVTSYWAQRRLKSPASRLFTQTFIPFVRGIHRWSVTSRTKASNAENVSIWWRHHGHSIMLNSLIHVNTIWYGNISKITCHVPRRLIVWYNRFVYFCFSIGVNTTNADGQLIATIA